MEKTTDGNNHRKIKRQTGMKKIIEFIYSLYLNWRLSHLKTGKLTKEEMSNAIKLLRKDKLE